eukprot:1157455-Pelagomonas_calceolata.AAC.2
MCVENKHAGTAAHAKACSNASRVLTASRPTSSTTTCDTDANKGSAASRRSKMPVVQKVRRGPEAGAGSPRSAATLKERGAQLQVARGRPITARMT